MVPPLDSPTPTRNNPPLMTAARKTQLTIALAGLIGAAWCLFLFIHNDIRDVLKTVLATGWGVAAVVAFHCVPMLCDLFSWRILIPANRRLSIPRLFLIRWMGDAVNTMLPVAQVGGELVRMRVAAIWGMNFAISAASVLADMTICVLTQIIFALSGIWAFFAITHRGGSNTTMIVALFVGFLAVGGFYVVQRAGIFRIGGAIVSSITKSPAWSKMADHGREIDSAISQIYSRRRALLISAVCLMGTWSTGAVEVWIALRALGFPMSYGKCYVLECASQAIRSALFILPGALGAQESGYLAFGAMLGISPQTSMALALIRRVRELAFGLPGVIGWQWVEWRKLGKTGLTHITPLPPKSQDIPLPV
jgi:putative membrane protein